MIYLSFPSISPVIFSLGPLDIRWYSIAYIIGFLFAWRYIRYLSEKKSLYLNDINLNAKLIDDLVFYSIIGLILGARLGYIIFYNLNFYYQNPINIFYVWEGGLSFHGGLVGIILAALFISKSYKTPFLTLTDLICISAPVGIFLGRISNFINGELYGRHSSVMFGIVFPNTDGQYRHPSQLYESFLEGLLLFIILNISAHYFRKLSKAGYISGLFLLLYGLFRFTVEFSREPDIQVGYVYNFLTMGMLLSLPMIVAGLFIMMLSMRDQSGSK